MPSNRKASNARWTRYNYRGAPIKSFANTGSNEHKLSNVNESVQDM